MLWQKSLEQIQAIKLRSLLAYNKLQIQLLLELSESMKKSMDKTEKEDRQKLYDLTLVETKDSPEYEADRRLIGHFCFDAPYEDIKRLLKNFDKDKVYEAAEKFEHKTGHKAV